MNKHWYFLKLLLKFHFLLNNICFPHVVDFFFQLMNVTLKIFIIFYVSNYLLSNITSITCTLHENGFSNKKQTKLYKFNRRSKTIVDIPLK